jgi:hypothetical protein
METQNSTETTAAGAGGGRSPFGPTLALVLTSSVGVFFLLAPLARWVLPTTDVPAPFPDHHQDAETLLFVFAFVVLLPSAAVLVPRLADRLVAATGEAGFSVLSALVAAGLIVAAAAVRAAGSGGTAIVVAMIVWGLLAAAALLAAITGRLRPGPSLTSRRRLLWWATGCGSLALVLSFTDVGSIGLAPLIVGALLVVVALTLGERATLPRLGRRSGLLVDGLLIVLLVLAIPNLVIFESGSFSANVELAIIHFHQNFFLGPANQVLGGGAMLIDTLSQYGVGSIYFLAALFQLIPIGDGTLGLIEGVLSALMFCGGYLVVRAAGAPRLLAAAGFSVAVVVFVYGLVYPLGALLQHGAFRFGLPMGVLLGAVIEARWPRRASAGRALQLLTMAVASIWALEAFGYTLLTILAVISVRVWMLAPAERRRAAVRGLIEVAVAFFAAHILFDILTLVFTGEFPRWGWYLSTLREFLTGPVGDLTYDFSRWSPGLALGVLYFSSAAGLILLLGRRPDIARTEPTAIVAIAGTTAMGIGLFSYLVNRSADHIIPYVSLPAVMLAVLWLTLASRPWLAIDQALRRAAFGGALLVSVLMIATAASSIPERFSQSALALARPGGESFRAAFDRLWDPPPLSAGAIEGEALLDRYMPSQERSLVIADADLTVEILTRSGRSSELPLGDPWEDSLVPDGHLDALAETVDQLQPGTRMLVDESAMRILRQLVADPDRDPIDDPIGKSSLVPSGIANLQQWALQRIGERFRLRTIAVGSDGLRVVELEPK